MKTFILNLIFTILWIIAIILFSVIIYKITISSPIEVEQLLVPLGVLISAGIASISVMKSIHNTNNIEKNKDIERINNANRYLKSIINNYDKELNIFNFILDTESIFKLYDKSDIEKNILTEEVFNILKDFYHSDKNKLFIGQIKSLITFLKNTIQKLEDKDIIYYSEFQEDKMYELLKITFLLIEVLESSLNNSSSDVDLDMQKYMIKIASFERYINLLQGVVNSFINSNENSQLDKILNIFKNRKISLNISSNISISNNGDDNRYFFIKVANNGYNSAIINNILLQYGLFNKTYIGIGENNISAECSNPLPTKIEVGDAISLCVNVNKEDNMLEDFYNNFKKDNLYLNIFTLKIVVNTASGKSFKNRVSKDIMNEIHYFNR